MIDTAYLDSGLRRHLVEIAFVRIEACQVNPLSGRVMQQRVKDSLLQFFNCLTYIASAEAHSYWSRKYERQIRVKVGQVRMSYEKIRAEFYARFDKLCSVDSLTRYAQILAKLGIINYITEQKRLTKNLNPIIPAPKDIQTKRTADDHETFKVLEINFAMLEEHYSSQVSIDRLIEQVNDIPTDDAYFESLSESELHFETDPDFFCGTVDQTNNSILTKRDSWESDSKHVTVPQTFGGEKQPENLVTPPVDGDWIYETCEKVDRERVKRTRAEFPEQPEGQFYASWIGERAGLQYAPWVLWDVDAREKDPLTKAYLGETVQTAFIRARSLITRLMGYGVPESAIRTVFSTRRGFHVYLDSRTIGLKPTTKLGPQLAQFCKALLPETDGSLYGEKHIIGIPNSKHRDTGLYYTEIPLADFMRGEVKTESHATHRIVEFKCLADRPRPVTPRAESMPECITLKNLFQSVNKPVEKGMDSLQTMTQKLLYAPQTFYGVVEGARNQSFFDYLVECRARAISKDEALALVTIANNRSRPPLPERDIKYLVNRVYRFSTTPEKVR